MSISRRCPADSFHPRDLDLAALIFPNGGREGREAMSWILWGKYQGTDHFGV
jgi:hypothetical protein